ncbi:hypothetical protein PFISCL1PPCAC_20957, partial [Pristionchus fissidentatus]
ILTKLKDFCCWTSTHGVPHIGMANRKLLVFFWGFVLIACIAGFFYQLRMLILKYLLYAVNTETKVVSELEFSERPFPAVMICHLNPWKANSIGSSPFLSQMANAYTTAAKANPLFGFAAGRTGERQQRAVKMTSLANEHLFSLMDDEENMAPHYTYQDLVISCSYNVDACNETDWTPKRDPHFGMCYVFNVDGVKTTARSGPLYGLRVVMRTDQARYLPWTEASGIVVSIYNETDQPFPDVFGFYAPPGTATAMGVRYVKTTRKEAPYGDCRVSKTAAFPHYKGKYEVESCYRSCLQEQTIKKCGCYDPTYAYLGGSTYRSCFGDGFDNLTWTESSNNLDCIEQLYDSEATTFNMIKNCTDCTPPCEVESYMVTVSTAQWPSNDYKPAECTAYNQTGQPWVLPSEEANEAKCILWYKINTLLIEVYYERMNYQLLTESAAYTIGNLISDIGGQLGLFLGMSLISILEILVLCFLLVWYCFTHKTRRAEMDAYQRTVDMEKRKTEEFLNKKDSFDRKPSDENRRKISRPRRKVREMRDQLLLQGMSNAVYNSRNLSDAYYVPPVQH